MNKKIMTFVLSLMSLGASAQYVVNGHVTDRFGNPLSGARVEAKGSKSYAMTGIDGRFSLEALEPIKKVRISSPSCRTQIVEVTPNMSVAMKPETSWNRKPTKYQLFASAQATIPGPDFKGLPIGVMVGVVKDVGLYGRAIFSSMPNTVGSIYSVSKWGNSNEAVLGDDYKTGYQAFTGGLIVRMGCPIYLTIGGGYYERKVAIEHVSGEYLRIDKKSRLGAAAEMGLMMKFGHIVINGGSTCWLGKNKTNDGDAIFTANFGIGYMF